MCSQIISVPRGHSTTVTIRDPHLHSFDPHSHSTLLPPPLHTTPPPGFPAQCTCTASHTCIQCNVDNDIYYYSMYSNSKDIVGMICCVTPPHFTPTPPAMGCTHIYICCFHRCFYTPPHLRAAQRAWTPLTAHYFTLTARMHSPRTAPHNAPRAPHSRLPHLSAAAS